MKKDENSLPHTKNQTAVSLVRRGASFRAAHGAPQLLPGFFLFLADCIDCGSSSVALSETALMAISRHKAKAQADGRQSSSTYKQTIESTATFQTAVVSPAKQPA